MGAAQQELGILKRRLVDTKCPLCNAAWCTEGAPLCPGCSQQVGAQEGEWVDKVVGEMKTRPPSQGFTPQVQAVLPLLA